MMRIRDFFRFSLNKNLFWVLTALVVLGSVTGTYMRYEETQKIVEKRVHDRARSLNDYFTSMRNIFHQQFLKSGLDLNDSTLGFLPAHAAALISDDFESKAAQKISLRNVSETPLNLKNKADETEIEAIKYFRANPKQTEYMKAIKKDGEDFFFFAAPIKMSGYCLSCHGKNGPKKEYIRKKYANVGGYSEDDIGGITSILIEKQQFSDPIMSIFWETTFFGFSIAFILLLVAYKAIAELTRKEALVKVELENVVAARTNELKNAYTHEKHLRSILRTVADVNQLLITADDINELVKQSADTLAKNEMFVSVKIALALEGELKIVAYCGREFMNNLTENDRKVFDDCKSLMLRVDDESISKENKKLAIEHGIEAAYILPLKSHSFADRCLGVLSIYTSSKDGFSKEDTDMLDELAGDIGFAVNSFVQKNTIDLLLDEKIQSYHEFIEALVDMIEQRDTYTAGHTQRVAKYALMIAEDMGVDEEDRKKLAQAARLHDIGKVVTPDSILLKPGILNSLEYELIKEHVIAGFQVLSNIDSYKELAHIIVHHHERYNGSGYPYGKQGDEIPLLGHILAIADSFDAMTTNRIYKPKKSVADALRELESLSGTLYHPDVAAAAVRALKDIKIDEAGEQAIGTSPIDQERLSYFFRDKLTRLYNDDYLSVVIDGRSNHDKPKSLTVISLVDFTRYNKEHMWEGGNKLLVGFAEFLAQNIKNKNIFRVKGDHFIVADYDGDMKELLMRSPLIDNGVAYRVFTMKAPFGDILTN